ncbi:hypothetical protein PAP_09540 [Palaeococcus pacificus DY20341]|uniref:2-dehydropantoate 2-reductase n=1 Tax=Palaeococcus pacificus DY20341 TaxID=1343739 RepID=A0A075M0H6_9EURY|nr:2-dehydropantoate 2-reductase [Palaeococcus pacificus]AIF70283.1 hypothetical protein PAP_09540 [Palaeococcus pacificus DY20341]
MKIYILGAGSIGSLFGALLARVEEDVTLIGREEHVNAINEEGLKVTGVEEFTVYPNAITHAPNENPDLLILATKSYSTKAALECVKGIIGDKTWVLSIQNGLGNEDLALKYTKNVLGGITTNGAMLEKWGVIRWTGKGITRIGVYPKGNSRFAEEIAMLFNAAGIKTKVSDNIIGWKWLKAIVNSAINPLGALLEVKNGYLLENDYLQDILVSIAREGCMVAQQWGISFEEHPIEVIIDTLKRTSDNYNSMLQDLKRGKKTEIDYINGKIVEYAEAIGLKAPMNELLVALIKAKEALVR